MSHAEAEGGWGITRKEACCRDKEGSLRGEGSVPVEPLSPSRVSQGRPVQAAVGPVSFPVADFILAPVRLPGRRSHASLRAGAGEIDREVSVISLKEVQWREVRSQTGPQACALGPIPVIPLPAAWLLPSCCSRFRQQHRLPP